MHNFVRAGVDGNADADFSTGKSYAEAKFYNLCGGRVGKPKPEGRINKNHEAKDHFVSIYLVQYYTTINIFQLYR